MAMIELSETAPSIQALRGDVLVKRDGERAEFSIAVDHCRVNGTLVLEGTRWSPVRNLAGHVIGMAPVGH